MPDDIAIRQCILNHPFPPAEALESTALASLAPVLVLGATGQIGLCAVKRLLEANVPVIAHYCHRAVPYRHPLLQWFHWDLTGPNAPTLPPVMTVIATTALWLLPPALSALREVGAKRLVAFSSSSVITKQDTGNAAEQRTIARLRDAEDRFWEDTSRLGMSATLLRPTLIYGLGLDYNIEQIRRMVRQFGIFPLYQNGTGLRQPVHADDLAIAALKAAESDASAGKTYFLPGGETLSYREMVGRIFTAEGKRPRFLNLRVWPWLADLLEKAGVIRFNGEMFRRMPVDLTFDAGPARVDFGFSARGFSPKPLQEQ